MREICKRSWVVSTNNIIIGEPLLGEQRRLLKGVFTHSTSESHFEGKSKFLQEPLWIFLLSHNNFSSVCPTKITHACNYSKTAIAIAHT